MRKLNLILERKNSFGGKETYLKRLSSALRDNNYKFKTIYSYFPSFLPSWIRVILFNIQLCLLKRNSKYFSVERIMCPDIYRAGDGVHKAYLKKTNKSKFNPLHFLLVYIESKCFKKANKIIANSHMVKSEIIENYSINEEKIEVIYNGIELKKIDEIKAKQRVMSEFNLKNQTIFLFVGSGYKRKGVKNFLDILSKIKISEYRAFIIGKEKKIHKYVQYSEKLGLKNKVLFLGPRKDVEDFYIASDFFILPTMYDPFSNVVLEALYFKNVVFTTAQNGASEILENNFIMSNQSEYSIIDELNNLLTKPDKVQKIKIRNHNKSKKYSIQINLNKTLKVLNTIANEF